ncbi:MAG: alpha/beta hydrolase [Xanthobacteraceae bacterium]|jgi:hypothetical protein
MATSPALVVLSCLLVQGCGNSESKTIADAEPAKPRPAATKGDIQVPRTTGAVEVRRRTAGDSFSDRFYPTDSFADRYAGAIGYAPQSAARDSVVSRTVSVPAPGSYKLAALSTGPSFGLPAVKQAHTHLIGFENSAFPYSGKNARGGGGGYSDNRVLVHVPAGFDARKPGMIVVFFHGHGATLERDVRDRQLLPRQISESGLNAVLVAPQLAYDARDSSAGKFWERDGFKRFMAEAADQLARVYGDPRASETFANMPVVIVAYSGGFETAAWCLQIGGLGKRVTGVVLLDALYGHLDKFSSWITRNRSGFFISAYTQHNKRRDDELARILRDKGVPVQHSLDGPLKPGTVAFLPTDGVRHRDYVTLAWTEHPVKDVLLRFAQR